MVLGTVMHLTPSAGFHGLQELAELSKGKLLTFSQGSRHYGSPPAYALDTDDDPCLPIPKCQRGFNAKCTAQEYLPVSLSPQSS